MPCGPVLLRKHAGSSVSPMHLHLSNFAIHTNIAITPNTSAVQQSSGQNALKFSPHWSQGLCVESDEAVVGELGSA